MTAPKISGVRIVEAAVIGALATGASMVAAWQVLETKMQAIENLLDTMHELVIEHDKLEAHREAAVVLNALDNRQDIQSRQIEMILEALRRQQVNGL